MRDIALEFHATVRRPTPLGHAGFGRGLGRTGTSADGLSGPREADRSRTAYVGESLPERNPLLSSVFGEPVRWGVRIATREPRGPGIPQRRA